jgi:uncharacterized membrane protein YhaH (DUF805 family)
MKWYIDVLKKYAVFSGRARRKEYWMYTLFNCIALVVLLFIGIAINTMIPYFLYLIAIILPTLAVAVRRLHDTGKSGWLILIALIPLIGSIVLLVFNCTEGTRAPNAYGPDPKQGDLPPYMAQQPQY